MTANNPAANAYLNRIPQRVRHTLRFRAVEVVKTERITPHLLRITVGGDELDEFVSPGFDDHVKLFFPDANGVLALPAIGPDGPVWPNGIKPTMRDYTPRNFDPVAKTLEIDFALHLAGPATRWAEQAAPGQRLGVGGPRGSFIVTTDFDWHLLVGDDTALPAIARRLAELPADAHAIVIAEVDSAADTVDLPTAANVQIIWAYRDQAAAGGFPLLTALEDTALPEGDFHAWVACESAAAKAVRAHLIEVHNADPKWIRASGYWRKGSANTHDSLDD
ncbi:iron utilization protein [Janthinobacterium sp. Marseille]|nr:siderophore-interacting protein [Janthinobacterium sp. Marseille]ABR88584.1 iron utilization protein [Janthinobacterium sp. Marseille]